MIGEIIRQSRDWATASRGRELFNLAADVLHDVFNIESGMFVYKKRFFFQKNQVRIYSPWGIRNETEESLSQLILNDDEQFGINKAVTLEKWVNVEKTQDPWKKLWIKNNINSVGVFPIMVGTQIVGSVVLGRKRDSVNDDTYVFSLCAMQLSLILEMLSMRRLAEHASTHDHLTNIFNRRGFEEKVLKLINEHSFDRSVIGILDIDHFKAINDKYGHKQGDKVLVEIARILDQNITDNGFCARFGGDEFVFVIRTSDDLTGIIDDMMSWFASKNYSVSIGCAYLEENTKEWEHSFKLADQMLYKNKTNKTSRL